MSDIDKSVYRGGTGEVIEKNHGLLPRLQRYQQRRRRRSLLLPAKSNIGTPDIIVLHILLPEQWIFCIHLMTASLRERRESLCWKCLQRKASEMYALW